MAQVETKLPKVDGVGVIARNAALASGELTLENGGNSVIDVKMSDILSWSYDAYNDGTAEIGTIDFTAATLIENNTYSMTVRLPNVVSFFGSAGSATSDTRESRAVYLTRTYTVSVDATPTADELAAAFAQRMNDDIYKPFTVNSVVGPVITIEACDATAGAFEIAFSNIPGAVFTATAPNVLPVGEVNEVEQYVNASQIVATQYDRHIIKYRKYVRHNAVKGLEAVKEEVAIVFSDVSDSLNDVAGPILDGTYTPVADYLGAPQA